MTSIKTLLYSYFTLLCVFIEERNYSGVACNFHFIYPENTKWKIIQDQGRMAWTLRASMKHKQDPNRSAPSCKYFEGQKKKFHF